MEVSLTERRTEEAAAPAVVRIGLFGAPGSGVSTAVGALGDRLGQPVQADEVDAGRCIDWLEYEGGRHRGRAIRTQVAGLSGPIAGWVEPFLESTDVVLFVADTSGTGMDASMAALHELRSFVSVREVAPTLMYLANKRDVGDALALAVVRSRLAIHDDESVLEVAASTGDGVRQAFVYAVREALRRLPADLDESVRERGGGIDELVRQARAATLEAAPSAEVDGVDDVAAPVEVAPPDEVEVPILAVELPADPLDLLDPNLVDEPVAPVGEPTERTAPVLRREHLELDDAGAPLSVEDLVEEIPVAVGAEVAVAAVGVTGDLDDAERARLASLPPPPVTSAAPRPARRTWGRRRR